MATELVTGQFVKSQNVVIGDVEIVLRTYQDGALKSWDGTFSVPLGKSVPLDQFTLILRDGRRGSALITRVNSSSSSNGSTYVSFVGSGPLR